MLEKHHETFPHKKLQFGIFESYNLKKFDQLPESSAKFTNTLKVNANTASPKRYFTTKLEMPAVTSGANIHHTTTTTATGWQYT